MASEREVSSLRLEIELQVDLGLFGSTPEEVAWFFDVLLHRGELLLHSNELGDSVGEVKILRIFPCSSQDRSKPDYSREEGPKGDDP